GYLSESMAEAVSPGGRVLGLDISKDILEFARRRNANPSLSYRQGDAMALSEPDGSFDVAVSMQVLEYIPDADLGMREWRECLSQADVRWWWPLTGTPSCGIRKIRSA
ncbi:MAG TPA: class I SAM-dependent methyltransferase, partial [Pseudolabrys sp.]